jgi:hypothetical protein
VVVCKLSESLREIAAVKLCYCDTFCASADALFSVLAVFQVGSGVKLAE